MSINPKKNNTNDEMLNGINNPLSVSKTNMECDCTFIVGPELKFAETIYANRWLFSLESPVFERMLFGDFQEATKPSVGIRLVDDDPMTVRHFRLLTCCSERASRMEALSLYETIQLARFCHKYMAISITKLCIDQLSTLLDTLPKEDLPMMFDVSFLFPNTTFYSNVQKKLIYHQYIITDGLNSISEAAFMEYISGRKTQELSHLDSFVAIEKYLKHNDLIPTNLLDIPDGKSNTDTEDDMQEEDKQKRTYLKSLLKYIDFSKMDSRSFRNGPGSSNILTWEQKYLVLSSLCEGIKPIILF